MMKKQSEKILENHKIGFKNYLEWMRFCMQESEKNERMRGVIPRRRMRARSETDRGGGEIVINSEE